MKWRFKKHGKAIVVFVRGSLFLPYVEEEHEKETLH